MIKVIWIDLDDTLLSFKGSVKAALREGFPAFGLPSYREEMYPVFERINNGLWRQIERGELSFQGLMKSRWNTVFAALGLSGDGEAFEKYFRSYLYDSAIPEPHAREALDYLHGRYRLCAASNGPFEQQMNRLELAGMRRYFTHFFISSRLGASKPDPLYYERCFAELREAGCEASPGEMLMIGDSLTSDMAGAANAGMNTCLYRKEPLPQDACAYVGRVIGDLAEVKNYL